MSAYEGLALTPKWGKRVASAKENIPMKRVAIILELADDEVGRAINALSQTSIRFAGMTAKDLMETLAGGRPPQPEDTSIIHTMISDGLSGKNEKPFRWSAEQVEA